MSSYPAETVEYLARKGRRGASNVAMTIVRWLFYNVSESPLFSFLSPFISFTDAHDLESRIATILELNSLEWDVTWSVPFVLVFTQENCVLVKVRKLCIQITVSTVQSTPNKGCWPVELCWYIEA
jgi:hypothetical protein